MAINASYRLGITESCRPAKPLNDVGQNLQLKMQFVGDATAQYIRHLGIEVPGIAFAEFDANGHHIVGQRHVSEDLLQAFAQLGDLLLAAPEKRDGLMIGLCDGRG